MNETFSISLTKEFKRSEKRQVDQSVRYWSRCKLGKEQDCALHPKHLLLHVTLDLTQRGKKKKNNNEQRTELSSDVGSACSILTPVC